MDKSGTDFLDDSPLLLLPTSKLHEESPAPPEAINYPQIFLISITSFAALFAICAYLLTFTRLQSRPRGFIANLSEIFVSEVQAVLASLAGARITWSTYSDVIWDKSHVTNVYAVVFCGYLVCDMFVMYIVDSRTTGRTLFACLKSKMSIYLHHLFFTLMVPPVTLYLRDAKGDHFIGCFLLMELPVIFLHLHHVLSAFEMGASRLYAWNMGLTIIVYFCLRIAIFPYMFYKLAERKAVSFWQIHQHVPRACMWGSGVTLGMQMYWFALMVRKALIGKTKRPSIKID